MRVRGLDLGQDPHPLDDVDRGPPQVDRVAARLADLGRPLDHRGIEAVSLEPVRQDRPGDPGPGDEDLGVFYAHLWFVSLLCHLIHHLCPGQLAEVPVVEGQRRHAGRCEPLGSREQPVLGPAEAVAHHDARYFPRRIGRTVEVADESHAAGVKRHPDLLGLLDHCSLPFTMLSALLR